MNLNDYIWVKLTPAGKKVIGEKTFMYNDAGDGWSRWQLWVFMQMFGEHIYMGNPNAFIEKNEILLTAPNTACTRRAKVGAQKVSSKSKKVAKPARG